ncbi:MAG: nuclear transport factor 2 family protein [Deltaproteobacteria bacterium]|nr:nuclear transport factor 2 family protein [Deltaproteobacteria bacterium]
MIRQQDAEKLVEEWVEAWNRRDLDAILEHYADEVELTSPFVAQVLGDPAGTLRGKEQVRSYFAMGLAMFPDLAFRVGQVCCGVQSMVVCYHAVDDTPAAELMVLNETGKIVRVMAHYLMD